MGCFDHVTRTIAALVLALSLASCDSLPDLENMFNQKKPLPGERKPVFADGVPGVPQGVPRELVRGYQPPATELPAAEQTPGETPAAKEAEKPKPKPRATRIAVPSRAPATSITVQPTTPAAAGASAWPTPPAPGQQQPNPPPPQWPSPSSAQSAPPVPSPWPAAPPPGTFSR